MSTAEPSARTTTNIRKRRENTDVSFKHINSLLHIVVIAIAVVFDISIFFIINCVFGFFGRFFEILCFKKDFFLCRLVIYRPVDLIRQHIQRQ